MSIPAVETLLEVFIHLSHHLNKTIKSDKALKLEGFGHEVQELVKSKRERRNSTGELKKNSKNHLSATII